jgi:hypothetical protein
MPPLDSNGNGASSVSRAMVMARLREMGVSGPGAQQAIDGLVLSNPQDRVIIAGILGRALSPSIQMYDYPGEYAASFDASSPGGSKVTTRLRVENF